MNKPAEIERNRPDTDTHLLRPITDMDVLIEKATELANARRAQKELDAELKAKRDQVKGKVDELQTKIDALSDQVALRMEPVKVTLRWRAEGGFWVQYATDTGEVISRERMSETERQTHLRLVADPLDD